MNDDDGCEWNPVDNRPTIMGEESHARASVILGDGIWRLCDDCAKLPMFKRFYVRKIIKELKE